VASVGRTRPVFHRSNGDSDLRKHRKPFPEVELQIEPRVDTASCDEDLENSTI